MEGINVSIWFWVAFNAVVVGLLAMDLGLFHRTPHTPTVREAAIWSATWVGLSVLFGAGILVFAGADFGVQFFTGYLIEYSLSVDNIFVFVLIFSYFAVPPQYQHRVLFWGILGALVMRGILIALGAALLHEFHWVIYLFGAIVVLSGVRMATQGERTIVMERNFAVRAFRRVMPVSSNLDGHRFFIRQGGRLVATPLLLVLLVVESSDLLFAVDSIPAIFAVTEEPFLVYTSNVCAILGLRSLYFLLSGVIDRFHYLKPALSLVLVWIGTKMLLTDVYKIPVVVSLAVVLVILGVAVVASLLATRNHREAVEVSTPAGRH